MKKIGERLTERMNEELERGLTEMNKTAVVDIADAAAAEEASAEAIGQLQATPRVDGGSGA